MKKIINFSLWGDDPKYCVGAIRNAELAPDIYPGWQVDFHVDSRVPVYFHEAMGQMDHVHVIHRVHDGQKVVGDWRGMFWRFEYACATGVDVMLSRDCDSRLSTREADAVAEWLESDKGFHIMRDHPWHGSAMLGGMWGCRAFALPEFYDLMLQWNQEDRWQTDQDFLNKEIYPRIVNDAMIHAQFHMIEKHAIPFPTNRKELEFIGQVFDENERIVLEHHVALVQALKMQGEPVR